MKTHLQKCFVAMFLTLFFVQTSTAQDADLGTRAAWMRGSWGLNWKPVYYTNENVEKEMSIEPFMAQIENLTTLDYIQLHLSESGIYSSCHTAPHDILESLWEGDTDTDGTPLNLIVPRASTNRDQFEEWLVAVKAKGLKTQVYVNSGNLLWDGQPDDIADVKDRWKEWCDDNATTFINSESYHTDASYPDREYYFCYAEYILKEYAERYGDLIDSWLFDTAYKFKSNGDDNTVSEEDSQRIYEAFADAVHAGNPDAAVSFNNGTGDNDPTLNPFATPTLYDDYTFGHPFGGAGDMADGVLYDYNYGICTWMEDYEGLAFLDDDITWNDNIVSHFDPKMSTTAWNRGATPCLTNDEFVLWNATGLIDGGAITWGAPLVGPFMTWDEPALYLHDYAVEQLTLADAYLAENQIQSSFTPNPNKTYYIDCPKHDLRLAATGESEDAYTSSASTTGADVEWAFVDKGNGYWHIQRAAGGSKPGLRSDNTANADMQETSSTGSYTYWEFSTGATSGTHFLTLPDGPTDYQRLQINNSGEVKMVSTASEGTWESFEITEVEVQVSNLALSGTATQSSTAYSGEASRAIDGDTNGAWSGGSVTHTEAEDGATWTLDLASEATIDEIVIYNRTDASCVYRLSDFVVFVWDESGTRTLRTYITTAPEPSVTIDAGGISGKSIMIKSNLLATALNLAEVEVYGTNNVEDRGITIVNDELSGVDKELTATKAQLKVYPNPAENNFVIELGNNKKATYSIINNVGQIVLSGDVIGGTSSVDVSSLSQGLYLLSVSNEIKSSTLKIVKK